MILTKFPTLTDLCDETLEILESFYNNNVNAYKIVEDLYKDDPEEEHYMEWNCKHYRISNLYDAWNFVSSLTPETKQVILDSKILKSEGIGSMNYTTFSRRINFNDTEMVEYYKDLINMEFAQRFNPTYKIVSSK